MNNSQQRKIANLTIIGILIKEEMIYYILHTTAIYDSYDVVFIMLILFWKGLNGATYNMMENNDNKIKIRLI